MCIRDSPGAVRAHGGGAVPRRARVAAACRADRGRPRRRRRRGQTGEEARQEAAAAVRRRARPRGHRLLMALVLARPCPFYILDEIEAALDDVNIGRLVQLLRDYREPVSYTHLTLPTIYS